MNPKDRAIALAETWASLGGEVLREMLSERIKENKDQLYHLMSSKPDTLTGKAAIRLASRAAALEDLLVDIQDDIKIGLSQPQDGAGN